VKDKEKVRKEHIVKDIFDEMFAIITVLYLVGFIMIQYNFNIKKILQILNN
jgi:hypothetical protein